MNRYRGGFRAVAVTFSLYIATAGYCDDWPRFRGPDGLATSGEKGLPLTWSDTENITWKTELPGPGSSSPIVAANRVFLTCYSGYGVDRASPGDQQKLTRNLVCINLADGRILWQRSVPAVLPEDRYGGMLADHGYASHTAVSDGKRVFVFFGKSGVLAFDLDGNPLWKTDVGSGLAMMGFGSGASLALYKNLVIVNANAESRSIIALDAATGTQVWKTDAQDYAGSWSTPVVIKAGGRDELVINMPDEIWGLDPRDGGLLWYAPVRGTSNTTVVSKDGVIYALGGGPGGSAAISIRAGGKGDASKNVVWKKTIGSYVPSPVVVGDYLYWVDDKGIAYCLKADSGDQVYRERLPGLAGGGGRGMSSPVYASLIAADGKLYAVSRHNGVYVLAQGPKFEVLAHNVFESDASDFNASPAIVQGHLLLRSNQALYCVGGAFTSTSRVTKPAIAK